MAIRRKRCLLGLAGNEANEGAIGTGVAQDTVKLIIRRGIALYIVVCCGGCHLRKERFHTLHVLRSETRYGAARVEFLQVGEDFEGLAHLIQGWLGDLQAARTARDEALPLEHAQRLSDRRATDRKAVGEVGFDEALARTQASCQD